MLLGCSDDQYGRLRWYHADEWDRGPCDNLPSLHRCLVLLIYHVALDQHLRHCQKFNDRGVVKREGPQELYTQTAIRHQTQFKSNALLLAQRDEHNPYDSRVQNRPSAQHLTNLSQSWGYVLPFQRGNQCCQGLLRQGSTLLRRVLVEVPADACLS